MRSSSGIWDHLSGGPDLLTSGSKGLAQPGTDCENSHSAALIFTALQWV